MNGRFGVWGVGTPCVACLGGGMLTTFMQKHDRIG